MPIKNSKAIRLKCPYCGIITSYLRRHSRKYHKDKSDVQLALDFNNLKEQPKCLNPVNVTNQ